MKPMIRLMLFGSVILSFGQAHTRAETDPVDVLKKADAATKAVTAVTYATQFEGLGESAAQVPKVKAEITSAGEVGGRPKYIRAEMWVQMPESEETKHLTAGTDGEDYYVIDHNAKKVYVDIDPAVLGSVGRYFDAASVREFGHATPFSDEINGKKQELLGECEIAGEEGYEIHVVYANDFQEATWCFSKKTYLPRRRVDKFKMPTGVNRKQQRVITELQVLDSIDAADFKLTVPPGYERIDDFYP